MHTCLKISLHTHDFTIVLKDGKLEECLRYQLGWRSHVLRIEKLQVLKKGSRLYSYVLNVFIVGGRDDVKP